MEKKTGKIFDFHKTHVHSTVFLKNVCIELRENTKSGLPTDTS